MNNLVITIKTLFGLEKVLQEELQELGYKESEILNRAVQLKGSWEDVYRLNFRLRVAISVLVEVGTFRINREDDLYDAAKKIDWTSYFDKNKTFAVKGAVFSSLFSHSQYPMLVVKDAIADTFRDKFGERPDVNVKSPQVMFDVYINDKTVTVSLNTSGLPLFQRGYRQEVGDAPINEVLAAGLLRLSGWDRKSTLIDPMCGAGTIAIEAALLAADIPSMIERTHYAFKNFKSYDEEAWERVRKEGNQKPIDLGFEILAYDIDGEMIQKAKRNSKVAPIGNMIKFERQDALTLEAPTTSGTLICNPPYEERMGENVEELYEGLGNTFKHQFTGFNCWVISSNMDAFKHIGLRPDKRIKVFNGNLECSFRQFQIFEGTKREQYQDSDDSDDNSEKTEGSEGKEVRIERPARAERTERAPRRRDSGERSDRGDRGSRYDRPSGDRSDRTDRGDRGGRYNRPSGDRPDRSDRTERPSRSDKPSYDRPERTERDSEEKPSHSKYGGASKYGSAASKYVQAVQGETPKKTAKPSEDKSTGSSSDTPASDTPKEGKPSTDAPVTESLKEKIERLKNREE